MQSKKKRKGERADGRIQVTLELPRTSDGKRRRKVFYGATRAEAMAKRQAYMEDEPINSSTPYMTVDEWAKLWLGSYKKGLRSNSIAWYRSALQSRISPAIGHMKITDVKPLDIQGIYNDMRGMAASTISQTSVTLKQLFESALENEKTSSNPAMRIKPPSGKRNKREAISADEIKLITKNWEGHRSGIWAMLMLYAGLRRGEMAALKWEDISFCDRELNVSTALSWAKNQPERGDPKTFAGSRSIPIPPPLYEALGSYPKANRTGIICASSKGKELSDTGYRCGWNGFLHYLKMFAYNKDVSFTAHMLRHTYATMLYDANIDVLTASKWMGHTDVTTTMRIYTHLSDQKEASSKGKWMDFFKL